MDAPYSDAEMEEVLYPWVNDDVDEPTEEEEEEEECPEPGWVSDPNFGNEDEED